METMKRCIFILLVSSLALTPSFMRYGGTPVVGASPSTYQGNLTLTGNNVTVIEGQFDINGNIIVEDNATLILRNAIVNFMQTSNYQYSMTFQNPAMGNPRLIAENSTLTSLYGLYVNFYGNSSCVADGITSWPISAQHLWWMYGSNIVSVSNSRIYAVVVYGGFFEAYDSTMRYLQVFGSASANASSSYIEDLTSFSSGDVIISDSATISLYTRYQSVIQLVNSTYSSTTIFNESRVLVNWCLDVRVVDMHGVPIDFVDVTTSYPNATVIESKLTDAHGLARFTLTQRMMNATGSYPAGNYWIMADHISGAGAGQTISITGNQAINVSLYINAQDYVVINPDGSITPSTANVTTYDEVMYTFTGDNYASIIVNRANIIIDGMGYTVQALGHSGFSLTGMHNVTIENTTMANSGGSAVSLYASSNCTVARNNMTGNSDAGVHLGHSSNCTVSGNNMTNNGRGIRLESSSGNVIFGNTMTNSTYGNFGVNGYESSHFMNLIDTSNLVNGKPVYYLMNQSNVVVSPLTYPEAGYLGLINCKNATVQDMTLTENGQGLLLAYTNDSTIIRNNFVRNGEGVNLYYCSGDVLSGNNITDCTDEGRGVTLVSSSNCVVSGNNITGSYWGDGVLIASSDCTLSGNNIANNYYDALVISSSSGCTISGNNIENNGNGISIYSSSGNTFYRNNFINNTQQVHSDGSPNTWDDGYPSGGNYWSDYAGVDLYHGSSQDIVGGDGIGDTNYTINADNIDRYPLMSLLKTFNAGMWNNTLYSADIVSNSTVTDFSFNPYATPQPTLSFSVTGVNGSTGFCRVAIPKGLMWVNTPDEWIIMVNGTLTQYYIDETGGYTYIHFNYAHSTETVKILSTEAIPEFQPLMLMPLFMIITLLGTFILKRKRKDIISG